MSLNEQEKATISYYNAHAREWAEGHGGYDGSSYWEGELARFRELLPAGRILEVGSGKGNETAFFIGSGYDYTGVDPSVGLLEIAREKNPGARLIEMSIDDLDFPRESFDGFWAAASLLHVPKDKINGVLSKIKKQIRRGGVGFVSLKAGEGEEVEEETGRLFAYYGWGEAMGVLTKAGFQVFESKTRTTAGRTTWLVFYVRV